MPNQFYRDFDFAILEGRKVREDEFRTPFQIDRDRIIHSNAFRSLQSKTQVFLSGQYDFYRTRLTHSIEVAQIGRSICHWLREDSGRLHEDFFVDADLVEAICLAHDLGHPPFGHTGERTLNRLMRDFGGFEGNAQTLRMLTKTIYANANSGMAPSRAFLDGVLKYKSLYSELNNPHNHFIYDEQKGYLDFAFDGVDLASELEAGKKRNAFRSVECQIMDWADDTAYSLNDVADGIQAGFITIEKLERWAASQEDSQAVSPVVEELLRNIREQKIEGRTGRKIGDYISACRLEETDNFMSGRTNRYRFKVAVDSEVEKECRIFKRIALDLVFRSQQLQQLDRKADAILSRLFEVFKDYYITPEDKRKDHFHLLSPPEEARIWAAESETGRARIVCDIVARMTDGFATRTYKRLFDADFGSIVDLV